MDLKSYTHYDSPVGPLLLIQRRGELAGLYFADEGQPRKPPADAERCDADFSEACDQLAAYFAGELREFSLPLAPEGTAFQLRVWLELRAIPFGQTISYGELARRIGDPNASRAVGAANGKNPISIIVPCHRVIGANGALTGFGGGIETKRSLLELESSQAACLFAESE